MESIIILALGIIVIFVLIILSNLRSNADDNRKNFTQLKKQVQALTEQIRDLQLKAPVATTDTQVTPSEQQQKAIAEQQAQEEFKQKVAAIEALRQQREKERSEAPPPVAKPVAVSVAPAARTIAPPPPPKESFLQRWYKNNPDIEKFIGENLVSKIGIAILVLAIGFFVKYAIDQNWILPAGRVAIGVACGGILIGLAHYLRNSYRAFSSVLAGGGIAVLYFSITLAFQSFHLFGQTKAFVIMLVITLFAVVLALLYNKQELAIIGLVGGFAAPLLVSSGDGNYIVLFTYLIILNTGLLIIAYFKSWRLLNLLNFIFTAIMYASWLWSVDENAPAVTYRNGFIFASVFYCLFFIINIAHNIKTNKKFIASDFGILLANSGLYFAAGLFCLYAMHASQYKGLFSAALAAVNLVVSYFLFRKQKVDANILYLLIGITLTFISLTAPIQLNGHYITLFWTCEAVLLYWLSMKSGIAIIRYASMLVWVLMLFSLFIDWTDVYFSITTALPVVFNKGFITTVCAATGTYLLFVFRNNEMAKNPPAQYKFIPGKNVFRIAAIVLLFIAGLSETDYQFEFYYPATGMHHMYLLLYTLVFVMLFTFITTRIKSIALSWQWITIILSVTLIYYFLSCADIAGLQSNFLVQQRNQVHFTAHWASALIAALLLYQLIQLIRVNSAAFKSNYSFVCWVLSAAVVLFFSTELWLLANTVFYSAANTLDNIERVYVKTGLPIIWGICSFIFMWLGMRFKFRTLRIISLSLFTITLIKLFAFDITNIPVAGKIAAFFCLGVLLLVVSFMYQRLKKIIIDDEKKMDQ